MGLPSALDLSVYQSELGPSRHVQALRHVGAPVVGDPGTSARQVALNYLRDAAGVYYPMRKRNLFSLKSFSFRDDFRYLEATVEDSAPAPSTQSPFRWLPTREISRNGIVETSVVPVQQTVTVGGRAYDLWGAGVRVVVHLDPDTRAQRVTSSSQSIVEDTKSARQLSAVVERGIGQASPEEILARAHRRGVADLGISEAALVAYLPRDVLEDGSHIVSRGRRGDEVRIAVTGIVSIPSGDGDDGGVAHRVFYDVESRAIVYRKSLASACVAPVFRQDPASRTGAFLVRPYSKCDDLDLQREPVTLKDLAQGSGSNRALRGPRVAIKTPNPLGREYDPPEQPTVFDFQARTNDFAAVNAYYHCDSMMSLVENFGFDLDKYFQDIKRPITVVHRAKLLAGPAANDGIGMNAYVVPFVAKQLPKPWNVRMLFGLGDLSDPWHAPLGLATDVRMVWHEFCHVLILAATGKTEFDFAHSAGDALAAIMCDPDSELAKRDSACRGITFPFVWQPMRRHDRDVRRGWGWNGALYEAPNPSYSIRDPAGYNAEQILSTTLFRLYRAIGGDDDPDEVRRWEAAYFVAYLIVRSINLLTTVQAGAVTRADQFADALMDADNGTQVLNCPLPSNRTLHRVGGTLHKVIRWAFEKQGLYQQSGVRPSNREGDPDPIDIYLDDGRQGEYSYAGADGWHATPEAICVRRAPDSGTASEQPVAGSSNYLYVTVRNRGSQVAHQAIVDVFAAAGAAADDWRTAGGTWHPLQRASPAAIVPHDVAPGQSVRFGPFAWTPQGGGRHAILARASVTGDRSNIDPPQPGSRASVAYCVRGPVPIRDLVPYDNNLGYREWALP